MNRNLSLPVSRRALLQNSSCGFGLLGLMSMLSQESRLQGATKVDNPLMPKPPHFAPRAKRVLFLFMHGGPSHIDTFDPKPRLITDNGKPLPFKRPLTLDEGQL